MSIDLKKLEIKLQAIKNKNLDEIIAKNTYIPSLGQNYTKKQLQDWLNKRSDFLIRARDLGETTLIAEKNAIYLGLSIQNKLLADKILNEEIIEKIEEKNWENIVLLKLYCFLMK